MMAGIDMCIILSILLIYRLSPIGYDIVCKELSACHQATVPFLICSASSGSPRAQLAVKTAILQYFHPAVAARKFVNQATN